MCNLIMPGQSGAATATTMPRIHSTWSSTRFCTRTTRWVRPGRVCRAGGGKRCRLRSKMSASESATSVRCVRLMGSIRISLWDTWNTTCERRALWNARIATIVSRSLESSLKSSNVKLLSVFSRVVKDICLRDMSMSKNVLRHLEKSKCLTFCLATCRKMSKI